MMLCPLVFDSKLRKRWWLTPWRARYVSVSCECIGPGCEVWNIEHDTCTAMLPIRTVMWL